MEVWVDGPKLDAPTYTEPGPRDRGEALCSKPKVFFRYADGTLLQLANGPHGGAVFAGDRGSLSVDRGVYRSKPESLAKDAPADLPVRLYKSDDHMRNWFECIRSKKLPAADIEIAHRSTTVCHLGNIARWLGRKLARAPVQETFPGDAEACGYIDRPRRKPWALPEIS